MKFSAARAKLPSPKNSLLAALSAVLLILAFPDFEIFIFAWFALIPLFYAVECEKDSIVKSFVLGWIFGAIFFFGSCWWVSYPMIYYAAFPAPVAYALVLMASLTLGLFPAIFCLCLARLLRKFGNAAIFAAPFLWTALEFLRFYATGNNWNAIAYSQAFSGGGLSRFASIGGIYLVGFLTVLYSAWICFFIRELKQIRESIRRRERNWRAIAFIFPGLFAFLMMTGNPVSDELIYDRRDETVIVAVQPDVPMSGLKYEDWQKLRARHIQLAEDALQELKNYPPPVNETNRKTVVIFPESPMNFQFTRDREFQEFLREFTRKNNVSVLFNAAEPSASDGVYNSAVLVNERGARVAQYDKIHLLPFGEFVPLPAPLAEIVPPVVGNYEFGTSYDLMPAGDVQAGIMICFESHFPTLSRQFAREGADVLIEMTNDGYLGDTPVLRQHLANAVFRAIETNRPVVRVTNVGITAFIDENGKILDETKPYTEATRIWTVKKSHAAPTFYVKYGDWFAWICSAVSLILLILTFRKKKEILVTNERG